MTETIYLFSGPFSQNVRKIPGIVFRFPLQTTQATVDTRQTPTMIYINTRSAKVNPSQYFLIFTL